MSNQIGEMLLLQAINSPSPAPASGPKAVSGVQKLNSSDAQAWRALGAASGPAPVAASPAPALAALTDQNSSRPDRALSMVFECERCGQSFDDFAVAGRLSPMPLVLQRVVSLDISSCCQVDLLDTGAHLLMFLLARGSI